MNDIQILGDVPLYGEAVTQGSKNAVLPMMAASLLHRGVTTLDNVPRIQDVFCMVGILEKLGARVSWQGHRMQIDASVLDSCEISMDYVRRMRSSIMVLGPLFARLGQAVTYYPGGCSIGRRPVDYHIRLLRELGAEVTEENGRIEARASASCRGAQLYLPFPSVGATENAVMAAVGATGETVIHGCAREPEIVELCRFLAAMGIETEGAGTDTIRLRGQKSTKDPVYRVCGDRIAAGTYLAAAAVTGGNIRLLEAPAHYMESTIQAFRACGCKIEIGQDSLCLEAPRRLQPISQLETAVYPGFPTDMQSVFLSVLSCADGVSTVRETIFEDRLDTAFELARMGASVRVRGCVAEISPVSGLTGAEVTARDLRGGAALIVAGLAARGVTVVHGCEHIYRGYETIVEDLASLGARIEKRQEAV